MIKKCQYCDKDFDTVRDGKRRKYCNQECYHSYKTINGYNGVFKKGFVPWNKGKKGIHLSPDSEFKKGNKPTNWLEVGSITIRNRKRESKPRRFIKIAEPNSWIEYARYVWEKENGKLKKGYVIHHKDFDCLNDDISNLLMMTRGEHINIHREAT